MSDQKLNYSGFSGEMFMSILWYYRLEHTGTDPLPRYIECEVFASRHRDVVPVACIEDRCYVLTLGEFNRLVNTGMQDQMS
jgi:BAH domain